MAFTVLRCFATDMWVGGPILNPRVTHRRDSNCERTLFNTKCHNSANETLKQCGDIIVRKKKKKIEKAGRTFKHRAIQ